MNLDELNHECRLGPPRVFVPICIRWPHGFLGGPVGYEERPADDIGECPVIIDAAAGAKMPKGKRKAN